MRTPEATPIDRVTQTRAEQPPAAAPATPTTASNAAASVVVARSPVSPITHNAATAETSTLVAAPVIANAPADNATSRIPEPTATATYDRDSAGVIPPVAEDPQLSGVLATDSPGIRADVLNIMVVVSSTGTVKSVKAVNAPRNIGESIVLLGALATVKSARFRPATRDGLPVAYRLIVPIRMASAAQ